MNLKDIAPDVGEFAAHAHVEKAGADGNLQPRVPSHEGAADDVGAVSYLHEACARRAVASAAIQADDPLAILIRGRTPQVPLPPNPQVQSRSAQIGQVDRGRGRSEERRVGKECRL